MSTPNFDTRYTTPSQVDTKIAAQAGVDAGQYVALNSQTLDVKKSFGAILNGFTDDTSALNSAIVAVNTGNVKHLTISGTALVSGPLTALGAGVIMEFKNGGIKVSSSYTSSSPVITLAGVFSEIRGNLQITGGSSSVASAIFVAPTAIGSHVEAINTNLFTGGWLLEAECGVGNKAPNGFSLNSVRAQNVNYGVWIHGHPGQADNDLQGFLTDLNIQSCTHDCLRIEDVNDVQVSLVDFAITGTMAGSADIHVVGSCSSIIIDNIDIGIYPATLATVTQPVVWLESSSYGAPLNVQILGGIVQGGFNNILVDAGDSLVFKNLRSQGAGGSGVKVNTTTSSRVLLDQLQFIRSNGQAFMSAGDVEVSSSATVRIRGCDHFTPIATSTAESVPYSYFVPAANNVTVDKPEFFGTGASISTAFSNPVRSSTVYSMAGSASEIPLRVRGFASQSANLFQVENYLGGQLFSVTQNGQVAAVKGAYRGVSAKTGSYGLSGSGGDDVIVFTITAAQTATLPTASSQGPGRIFTIINATASTAALTITVASGTVPVSSLAANTALTIVSDGTNWQRIA